MNWNPNQVQEWLKSLSIEEEVIKAFADNSIDGSVLLSLSNEDLKNDLGFFSI